MSHRPPRPTLAVLRAAVLVVTGVAILAASASPAMAVENGGDPAQGIPPCAQLSPSRHNTTNMYDPRNGAYMGYAALVYSAGCRTEWTVVHPVWPYRPYPSVWLQNRTGTDLYEAGSSHFTSNDYWTDQLPNMQYRTACGGVQMYDGYGHWLKWVYLGCY